MLKKIYDWLGSKVHAPYADYVLCILFYFEALFLIPVDPILILYCVENRKKSLFYAALATVSSVIGGISGYLIGSWLWDIAGKQILHGRFISYILPFETFEYLRTQYHHYSHWAILISGFTPIPYKAATLTAGFCKLPVLSFIVCSLISRGARFFLIAIVIRIWGAHIKSFIDTYFNMLTLLFVAILVFIILLL